MDVRPAQSFGHLNQACITGAIAAAVILLAQPAFFSNRTLLLWNVTDSAPKGLYVIERVRAFRVGDYVAIKLPIHWRRFAAKRGYLPVGIPLVKRVAAIEGDVVCSDGASIKINKATLAKRFARDGRGRRLPSWHGCRTLGVGQIFLLGTARAASFDGRYFGASDQTDAIGKGHLLWAS